MPTEKVTAHVESVSAPAPAPSPAIPTAPSPAPAPPIYLTPPPASASIPAVPSNFVPQSGTDYRGIVPKKAELVALPLAVADLRKFSSYAQVIGSTAAPYEEILETFDVTNQWSSMRTASSAWDVYSQDQEGICWGVMRPAMENLRSAFDLAATRDPSLPARLPGLAAFLGAKASIAHKAVSTKRLNKKAEAEGKLPIHGAVGKKRLKAANRALVAAANAAAAAPTAPSTPAPSAAPHVVSTAPAPVASPVFVVSSSAAPAVPALPVTAANGAASTTNGAGH